MFASCKKHTPFSTKPQLQYSDFENKINLAYNINKQINKSDSSLLITLQCIDTENDELIICPSILLHKNNVLNIDSLSLIVKNNYLTLISKYNKGTILRVSNAINRFATKVFDTLSERRQHSFAFQGILIFRTILMGVMRDINYNGAIDFTIFQGYTYAVNGFACEEDIVFNLTDFKKYLQNRKRYDNTNEGIDYYLSALQNDTSDFLNFKEIKVRLQTFFNRNQKSQNLSSGRISAFRFPQGAECGCCGNYAGPCYYWSPVCLAHDYACQTCLPVWFCFGGCVASSCTGNTISWEYWL